MANEKEFISVYGARVHNLKNIDIEIPRNQLVVITGLSGSGKSSLAFDTIYAEGQRRFIDTLSSYARQFIGGIERPDVDKISGLSPVISIEQKSTTTNPRSTVGTITEIYDFLRLLYARAADAFSYETNEKMIRYTDEQILNTIQKKFNTKNILILAPLVKNRKGHYKELFEHILKKGYLHAMIDGKLTEIGHNTKLDRYKNHSIDALIDRFTVNESNDKRLKQSIDAALKMGKGSILVMIKDEDKPYYFSKSLMCPTTGISYAEPAPHNFSFNSPKGYCPHCKGLGTVSEVDIDKIIPDKSKSIKNGAIEPLGPYKSMLIFWQIEALLKKHNEKLSTPVKELDDELIYSILYGSAESLRLENSPLGPSSTYSLSFDGVISYLSKLKNEDDLESPYQKYLNLIKCPECGGKRLNKEALNFKIDNYNIIDLAEMDISELYTWFNSIESRLSERQNKIAAEINKEIKTRIGFLIDVGLTYLNLNRSSNSLSGGESQRIRLATQIGSQLVNVLYILDEPSIGLHQKDNIQLINSLKKLRNAGNSIIVVEHDKEMIMESDYVIDIGPGAGVHGGQVVSAGKPSELKDTDSLTAKYLKNIIQIPLPSERRKGNGNKIIIKEASGNNLKKVNAEFPLGTMICITGVSGSGKSTLINETLFPIISNKLYRSKIKPLSYSTIEGLEHIDKIIAVDQAPLGRTPRSNPATYTGVFTDIRNLFAQIPEAKIRGYTASRFSFNIKGGRCETCKGAGVQTIEMNFLPDVYVPCNACQGKRYNRETLEVVYKGKSINDILEMTIEQSTEFFSNHPSILNKVQTMNSVGLGYIKLGQPSTTLSGGESQRVKLSAELARRSTSKTMYVLDEPTTGLHFEDVRVLLTVLNQLVEKGNTVITIEHNMDIIKSADYIIDLGKDGGKGGGTIIGKGTPEHISKIKQSYTGIALANEF